MESLTKEQDFELFCLEQYKTKKQIKATIALFDFEHNGIFDFLEKSYDVLHTQGISYILQEIEDIISAKKDKDYK